MTQRMKLQWTKQSQGVADNSLSFKDAVWLLSAVCSLNQLAFDAQLFAQRFPPPLTYDDLNAAADELGLHCERRRGSLASILAWRLPVSIALKPQPTEAAPSPPVSWALILNADEERALVLRSGEETPEVASITDLQALYVGRALLLSAKTPNASDPDGIEMRSARFGLRWFVPELLKHRAIWRDVLTASLVLQLIALSLPLFTQAIIDKVVVHRTQSTLVTLGIAMGLFLIFTSVLTWVRQYLLIHTGQRVDAVLGAQVFERLFRLPLQYFQSRPTGVIAARLHGIETVREFVTSSAVTLALDLPFLLIFLAVMFWYSVPLTLLVLAILAVIVVLSALIAPMFRERLNEQFLRGAANQAFITEYVAGAETVKALQFEPQLGRRYRDLLKQYLGAGFATGQLANTYNTWASGLEQLMTLTVLLVGAWIVMHSVDFTVGMLVAFQMFAGRISQPMLKLVGVWQQWQQSRIAIDRLGDIMNAPTEQFSAAPRRPHSKEPGVVSVQNLGFRYDDKLPFLYEDLSLEIGKGELVALMGPSGSGKSTLAKLMQGFLVPTKGIIRVDGVDIARLSANELRMMFGVVPQETVLFSGTILYNLKLGNPYASFEQVVAACKMAEIHATIEALPQGYQTEIGERGTGLSGGQRQRLSIARALLKGPRILIFDESTSAVDPITAEQLARTINALKGRTTILFIAHHLPKSLHVDRTMRIGEKLSIVPGEKLEPGAVL